MNLANMSLCVSLLRLAVGFCSVYSVLAVLLPYNPALQSGLLERNDLIENYFHLGLTATEILMFLLMVHGINLSRRQLKIILQRRGLRRRGDASDAHEVFKALNEELSGSGSIIAYRAMHQRLTVAIVD